MSEEGEKIRLMRLGTAMIQLYLRMSRGAEDSHEIGGEGKTSSAWPVERTIYVCTKRMQCAGANLRSERLGRKTKKNSSPSFKNSMKFWREGASASKSKINHFGAHLCHSSD